MKNEITIALYIEDTLVQVFKSCVVPNIDSQIQIDGKTYTVYKQLYVVDSENISSVNLEVLEVL